MGQLDDGSYFVVLEYLDGVELAHAVAAEGSFPVRRAARVMMQLCEALTAVHAAGIVHRDLKPENLFLVERQGERDFLKVLDFGVCKVHDPERSGERPLTHTGVSLGTPQFMAPEQIESSATVDVRTDIYAAGAILYYALTGQAPFDEPTLPRLLLRICSEPPPLLRASRPELPVALEAVIARAMARLPEDRYQTSDELRAALEPFAAYDEATRVYAAGVEPATTFSASMLDVLPPLLPARRSMRSRASRMALLALIACAVLATRSRCRSARKPKAVVERDPSAVSASAPPALKLDLTPAFEPAALTPLRPPLAQRAAEAAAQAHGDHRRWSRDASAPTNAPPPEVLPPRTSYRNRPRPPRSHRAAIASRSASSKMSSLSRAQRVSASSHRALACLPASAQAPASTEAPASTSACQHRSAASAEAPSSPAADEARTAVARAKRCSRSATTEPRSPSSHAPSSCCR